MKAISCGVMLAFLAGGATLSAEVVQFKNGDHLTGEWQRVVGNKIM